MRVMQKATRQQTRAHNKRLILKTIYRDGEISRADIARSTRLTRTTVSHIVTELMDDQLVIEIGRGPSEGGKPPVLLSIPPLARQLVGLDLADSEFRGGVIDLRGNFQRRASIPVLEQNGDEALGLAYGLLDSLLDDIQEPVLGIGIGTPGLVDAHQGVVRQAVNLDWQDIPLRDLLEERYGLPVFVGNDSHVAALGQFTFGRIQGIDNLVVVKVGRGVSAGTVLNGRLHFGDGSGAGEIGHVRAVENGLLCLCGHSGCLETVASTRMVVKQARDLARRNPRASINKLVEAPEQITTEVVLQGVQAGDSDMCRLVAEAGRYLGKAIAHLIGALNIEQIIIAGSMARFGPVLLDAIRDTVEPRAMGALVSRTQIDLSDLGQDIVMLGAAALVMSSELGVV